MSPSLATAANGDTPDLPVDAITSRGRIFVLASLVTYKNNQDAQVSELDSLGSGRLSF